MKISRKISLSFLITAVILTIIGVSIVYTVVRSNLEKEINDHLITAAVSRANHLKTFLEGHKLTVHVMLSETLFIEFLSLSKDNPEYDKKLERVSVGINEMIKANNEILKINLLDKKGVVVVSTDEALIGSDYSSNDGYIKAKEEGLYIEDIHLHGTAGIPAMAITASILVNNEFLGVIVADLSVEALYKITLNRTGLGETGEIYLVNKDFYMISPSRFKEGVVLKQKVDTVKVRQSFEDMEKYGSQANKHDLREEKDGGGAKIYEDYRGLRVIGADSPIPEMQWALLAEIDATEALAPLRSMKLIFILVLTVVPILGWLFGVAVSRMISGPIHKLHEGTEIIAEGNLDYKVGTNTKDEIGQLSRAFDKMTEDLRKTTTSIDELNKEIVKRRQVEKELRGSEEKIRTRELVEAVLLEAKETAEAGSRAKSEFLTTMSHELRTPLNSVVGFAEILADRTSGDLNERQKQYTANILKSGQHLLNLINDILIMAEMEAGKIELELSEFDISGVIHRVLGDIEPIADQKNIALKSKLETSYPTISAEEANLKRILHNLLSNAVKFTPDGGEIRLTADLVESSRLIAQSKSDSFQLSASDFELDRDWIKISIQDTGIGIKPEDQERIFNTFVQIDSSYSRWQEGTGLGLALSRKLVQRHGGHIWVESEGHGRGSTFTFVIPVEAVEAKP